MLERPRSNYETDYTIELESTCTTVGCSVKIWKS